MPGDWLIDLPPESDVLSEVSPEDEIDPVAFDRALRENRGAIVLDLDGEMSLDQREYQRVLREERRGQRPPGLREGQQETRCAACTHYDGDDTGGICGLFTYSVGASDVCDKFDALEA